MVKHLQKGFTLIELLIVIALLGALAIGLLGAVDPLEQIKKGTDTGTRNTVAEFHAAVIRYYAIKGLMPWCTVSTCDGTDDILFDALTGAYTIDNALMTPIVQRLIDAGELKSNFQEIQSASLDDVSVYGTESEAHICYKPTAKSFRLNDNTKYTELGEVETVITCGATDATACYWCIE